MSSGQFAGFCGPSAGFGGSSSRRRSPSPGAGTGSAGSSLSPPGRSGRGLSRFPKTQSHMLPIGSGSPGAIPDPPISEEIPMPCLSDPSRAPVDQALPLGGPSTPIRWLRGTASSGVASWPIRAAVPVGGVPRKAKPSGVDARSCSSAWELTSESRVSSIATIRRMLGEISDDHRVRTWSASGPTQSTLLTAVSSASSRSDMLRAPARHELAKMSSPSVSAPQKPMAPLVILSSRHILPEIPHVDDVA